MADVPPMRVLACLSLLLLAALPARAAETFETAFLRSVDRYCEAVDDLAADVSRGRVESRHMTRAVGASQNVEGFIDNTWLEGIADDHRARLVMIMEKALGCRDRAEKAGAGWWTIYRATGGMEPYDKHRLAEWGETLHGLGFAARAKLAGARQ